MAWLIESRQRCGSCGTAEFQWPHLEADVYVCEACAERERLMDRLRDNPATVMPGSKVWLFPREAK